MADRYLVTARKYRPAVFSDLVAQDHVADTLKNAIRLDRLAHAYLFSGPRGVGKTTAARILAKAINCETPLEERPENAEPCRTCDSCQSFEEGRSLNIFEIDAASNNKVDDIRELRESVRIPPQGSQKKVYIIDEVHMLSNQAFNALLKTLEEPPPHVLFIFATTEPHKVLPTILSRCQRFDFRRIPVPRIVTRLQHICENEGITADEESLMLIARKGDGALRDALSAFDQAVSLCGDTLTYSELAQALGVVDRDLFFQLVDHVANSDSGSVLQLVQHVMSTGYDLQEFLSGLTEHLRHLLVAHTLGPEALSEIAESARPRYVESSSRFSEADLLRLLMIVGEAETDVKQSSQPRLKLELALLNMAHLSRAGDVQKALAQLDTLAQHAQDGTFPTATPSPSPEASPADTNTTRTTNTETPTSSEPAPDLSAAPVPPQNDTQKKPADAGSASHSQPPEAPTPSAPASDEPAPDASHDDDAEDPDAEAPNARASETEDETPPASDDAPADPPDEADSANEDANEDDTSASPDAPRSPAEPTAERSASESETGYLDLFGSPALSDDDDDPTSGGDGAPTNAITENTEVGAYATAGAPDPSGDRLLATLQQTWPQYVEAVKQTGMNLGSMLNEADPLHCNGGTLHLAVPQRLHRDTLRDNQEVLLNRLPDPVSGTINRITLEVRAPAPSSETTATPSDPRAQMKQLREKYDGLNDLFTMFGAEPVW